MRKTSHDFAALRLKVASPDDILSWSYGEVIKAETINYRTQRPEKDGLFSERIFGPTKDWECYCGKYRRIRYKGVTCDKCNVEVTRSIVRRHRMGHIALAAPVAHIWYVRNAPSKLSLILDVPLPKLEKVIYYAAYMVTSVDEEAKERALTQLKNEFQSRKKTVESEGITVEDLKAAMSDIKKSLEGLRVGVVLSENEYHELSQRFGDVFQASMGAEAIEKILRNIDLGTFVEELRKEIKNFKKRKSPTAKEARQMRRLKIVTAMHEEGVRPEWMILSVVPVIPPDLRPMVALDGGRYATSDLNDLYRRVINRNNRLKKLMDLDAPEVIIVNEKRMLQEAVDALIDNSSRGGSQQLSSKRRPLRSLADMLKGKQGRFRQNLLGKRVDYSGRSVIVVGPELKLHECGLPKKMALELFRPFVIAKIIEQGLAHNVKNSNRIIEAGGPEVWAMLEEVIKDRRVLLNRAPTLHRLGIQAFEPKLIEDFAIQLHPLVCTAFNADFDGDQMAVHLPLSDEAQNEAKEIMLSSVNLLKPATGDPITTPSQDMVLGVYYLTTIDENAKGAGLAFSSRSEAEYALEEGIITLQSPIKVKRSKNDDTLDTSLGRIIFNSRLPEEMEYLNEQFDKRALKKLVSRIINEYGLEEAPQYLDAIKEMGFTYATRSGITWSIGDLHIPKEKKDIIADAEKQVKEVYDQYNEGFLTAAERKTRIISIWTEAKKKVADLVPSALDANGPIYSIINSGARGSWTQIVQVTGMKGNVVNANGEIIELPITSSFREGFNVLEFFNATPGARKGTTDTALKTAAAGYLTRRLVDVSQDLVIREATCGGRDSITLLREDGLEYGHSFADRLFSRTLAEDAKAGKNVIAKSGTMLDAKLAAEIDAAEEIESLKVYSPITCKTLYGICARCYGFDLGRNAPIEIGEAVGVVAAQSIGEPGTQLTMRTFHIGGVAGADITNGLPRVVEVFEVRPPKGKAFMSKEDGVVTDIEEENLNKIVKVTTPGGKKPVVNEYSVPRTSTLKVKVGDEVKRGDTLCDGNVDLREVLELKGHEEVEREIVRGVQRVYMSEGAAISSKHIEIMARQMFSRVKVTDPGDSEFVIGEILEKSVFIESNRALQEAGKAPAKSKQLLMGITKVALSTESFLSAASFQETARVLINSAVEGKVDRLRGLKENVIIGRMIPAGRHFGDDPETEEDDDA